MLLGPNPPTALFTSQNPITIDAVRAIHDLGLQGSVALVGFGDVGLADVVAHALFVIAQDPARLERAATQTLSARLDGFGGPSREITLTPRVVARGSGELAPRRT